MVFCNKKYLDSSKYVICVTILILIDGFLQYQMTVQGKTVKRRHNPYFNRWFSAIKQIDNIRKNSYSHNPYFNRWFSAIDSKEYKKGHKKVVTILILIDGFLQ